MTLVVEYQLRVILKIRTAGYNGARTVYQNFVLRNNDHNFVYPKLRLDNRSHANTPM